MKMMKNIVVTMACLSPMLAFVWPAQAQAERVLDGDPAHGALLFQKNCASCHGAAGAGGKAKALNSGAMINAQDERALLEILTGDGPDGLHNGLKRGLAPLDAWDIIGYLRSRVVMISELFPKANHYIVKRYSIDKNAKNRIKRSTGKAVDDKAAQANVFTLFKRGTGAGLKLVPQNPRLLDGLKRKMKQGYVVFVPFRGKELALALDPKQFHLVALRVMDSEGHEDKDLNKLLSRYVGKGDRRLSGKPKARLKAGGGGRKVKALEADLTRVYVLAAELATAYEIEERERSWADDDVELPDPTEKNSDDDFSVK